MSMTAWFAGVWVRKTTHIWVEQHFTYKQKRQRKINFNCECLSPKTSRSHPQPMLGNDLCTLSVLQVKDSIPSLFSGDRHSRTLAREQMSTQNKDLHFKPGIRKAISKQRDRSSTSCEGSFSSCKKMFQAQGHCYATVQDCLSYRQRFPWWTKWRRDFG